MISPCGPDRANSNHVHGGQAGADDRHRSFGESRSSWLMPRIRDVAGKIQLPDGLTREAGGRLPMQSATWSNAAGASPRKDRA